MTTMLGLALTGRRVLLVGGGAVAARRLERFLADGALVRIVAPELAPQTHALIVAHGDAAGQESDSVHDVEWVRRRFAPEDIDDVWLVHCATGDLGVDREIAALCDQQRVFCINASDGAHGSARMTAQTTSGDVVVGVSSEVGVDPRRAAGVRDAIAAMLESGRLPLRRRRAAHAGRVDLIGGGPGPVDLMTVRARRLLAEADVVIADRLGPTNGVIAELDSDVLVIDVGKRPHDHPVPQDEINALLVEHASAGKRVVRLKGGDPFVYGRGGEEVIACQLAGIPVEVTPGVSSAISVPQAAGIPVTHRGTASALHIVNGQGDVSATTLQSLADPLVTTAMLMGVAALPKVVRAALGHGISDDLPVAIVENGHTPRQRTTRSTLGEVVAHAAAVGVQNPAVIVFGEVARAGLLMPESVRPRESHR
ncbi:uroporphyrinogen-III C-methyltransferase [Microbacterium murale]|uniref:uroporphyrinogen-III C-methyltransferase n=1 Tax=Microbacterium murale TaxID=1081040 RepID=A0ABU0PDU3_9MICO|nr:uroporphyrinogen-III C-methyltransferase [Microbacterium murale]MDQ0645510.1 uroporphyrin-III C-methyltransferase/precorrin-2 dehydrogenase/sirohydrochlorin ferrochelatase [Microbacterium murale]